MKFIFKRLRRHWQSLRCLITPFPSASRKAVRKTVDWEASYGRTRGLFWQLVGKSPLVWHQAECRTVWCTFTSAANRNTVKKPPWPPVWLHGTCQLLLSHSSVATDGHFIKSMLGESCKTDPKASVSLSLVKTMSTKGDLESQKWIMTQVECHKSFLPTLQILLQKIRTKL